MDYTVLFCSDIENCCSYYVNFKAQSGFGFDTELSNLINSINRHKNMHAAVT